MENYVKKSMIATTPLLKFGGCFECYSLDVLDNLTKIMEEL